MAAIFLANLIEFHREGFKPRARHHRGADHRRGARTFAAQRREVDPGQRARADRRRVRAQRRRRRRAAQRPPVPAGGAARGEGLPDLRAGGDRRRRSQRVAAPRQPDLPAVGGADQACAVRFPAAAQSGHARQFRDARRDRSAADGRRDQGAARGLDRRRGAGAALGQSRPTTRRCAPPASPRCSRPARSRTRCRRPRARP